MLDLRNSNLILERRSDFPLFRDTDTIYLDTGASAQKPDCVINAIKDVYSYSYANVHRGVYKLSEQATDLFESSRDYVREFLNARHREEIIFTKGTTESINLVAYSWGNTFINPGDEIVVTLHEHHSNFVPWQLLANKIGAKVRYVKIGAEGDFDLGEFKSCLSDKTKLVATTHVSNALGIELPVKEIITESHAHGAVVVLDVAQSIPHRKINVQELNADFVAFSGHKIYGPTGIGVLYVKKDLLETMPPFLGGGGMIESVSVSGITLNQLPYRFEAGTPNIVGAIGLKVALEYVTSIGLDKIYDHEHNLITELESGLSSISEVKIVGPKGKFHSAISFTVDGVHVHDLAEYLDSKNIAVRVGHHCAQPLLEALGHGETARASVGLYNNSEDIKVFCSEVKKAVSFFKKSLNR